MAEQDVLDAIAALDLKVSAILEDTGTTLPAAIEFVREWILGDLVGVAQPDGTHIWTLYAVDGVTALARWTESANRLSRMRTGI